MKKKMEHASMSYLAGRFRDLNSMDEMHKRELVEIRDAYEAGFEHCFDLIRHQMEIKSVVVRQKLFKDAFGE
jgi:hypothetical protein